MATTTPIRRTRQRGAGLRWAPVLSAAYAQTVAFAAAATLALIAADAAAEFAVASAWRLWPPAALALGLVAAANSTRRSGAIGPAKYTGGAGLAALTLTALASALAPTFWFLTAAALGMGIASGLAIAVAGRVLAAASVGDGTGSLAVSSLALALGTVAGVGALALLPGFGWRGVLGLVVVAAGLAAWKFAECAPRE